MKNKGIFIFGYMHCGTSLLQHILAKHSDIFALQKELKFIEYLPLIKHRYPDITKDKCREEFVCFCVHIIYNSFKLIDEDKNIDVDKYKKKLSGFSSSSEDHLVLFFEVYDFLATQQKCKYWMEGSPNSVFYIDEIRKVLPDSKNIIIVRDVRDVLASKKKRKQNTTISRYKDVAKLARKKMEKDYSPILDSMSWKNTYALCKTISQNTDSSLIVRYEDLTTKPEDVVLEICSFLGISFDQKMLEVEFQNSADTRHVNSGIFSNSMNYTSQLTNAEIHVAQEIAGNLLKWYNYELVKVSISARLGSIKEWLRVSIQLVKRVYKRYQLLGFAKFIAFIKFNLRKVRKGV